MKKVKLFLFFVIIVNFSFSQNEMTIELKGVILNPLSKGIKDCHIVNLGRNKGTVSNSEGKFSIEVKKGDWLLVSNIVFKEKK
ncbi:hypothetical protein NH341_02460 [Tenacibaculum sp. XPcli2-G]|uniref:hypothetical protein n=1 Tax=Tenacibaculum sp. XPcli2-G TaxID=2954503 RepID=UPI0020983FF0|nr:hypothetical protein [Tenacibaculum sp. XPcli2-G]MCO7184274.1 hypothetical protein [Tenacibaculum sp. XPcli2-G]